MTPKPPKVWGIGLPRSGGQSLQRALQVLFPGQTVWHSPGNNWDVMDQKGPWIGAVEVFTPIEWLEREYPGSLYLYNDRDPATWLESCRSVYPKSKNYNHPIWKHHINWFPAYREEYIDRRVNAAIPDDRFKVLDICAEPNWIDLCLALQINIPKYPFPRVDAVKGNRGEVIFSPGNIVSWSFDT